jgi:hypothetical protein
MVKFDKVIKRKKIKTVNIYKNMDEKFYFY